MRDKSPENGRRTKRGIAFIIIIVGVIAAGLLFLRTHMLNKADAVPVETVAEETPTPTPTPEPTPTATPTPTETPTPEPTPTPLPVEQEVDFQELWKTNLDAYAYLVIPDTTVSYPVMQSSHQEEDYYLDHTFEDEEGLPGSIFTRKDNAKDFSDYITVIYGHDMANRSFFGCLRDYNDKEFLEEHKDIYIYLPESRRDYRVIAQGVYADDAITAHFDWERSRDVLRFMRAFIRRDEVIYADDYQLELGDKILILSTCIGGRPENRRLIIARFTEEHPVILS